MNAIKARQIVAEWNKWTAGSEDDRPPKQSYEDHIFAEGYLKCLEGEEVAAKDAAYASLRSASDALVEAIENGCPHFCHPLGECPYELRFDPLIKEFRKAVGEKGR